MSLLITSQFRRGTALPPDPGDQTPLSVTFASLEDQNLTAPSGSYYGWSISTAHGNIRDLFYRKGTVHTHDGNSEMVRFRSVNGGAFTGPVVIHSEPGMDIRNYGGGSTKEGMQYIFYARMDGENHFASIRVMRRLGDTGEWIHSGDLPLYIEGSTDFSPHGPMVEEPNGTLWQAGYCKSLDGLTWHCFTWRCTDGINWTTPTLIGSDPAYFEPTICYLSPGKWMAGLRRDESVSVKVADIFNGTSPADFAFEGTLEWGEDDVKAPGVAPLLTRKDNDTAVFTGGYRGSLGIMIQFDVVYGSAHSTGPIRFMHKFTPSMDSNDLEGGYILPIVANYTEGVAVPGEGDLLTYYQTATTWTGSGAHVTDVMVGAMFRKKYFDYSRSNAVLTTGIDNYFALVDIRADEISGADEADSFRIIIREAGDYTIRVVADLGANATGTHRTITVERENALGEYVEDLQKVIQDETDNTFDFNDTHTFTAGQYVRVKITHDATGDITAPSLRVLVEKQ